MNLGSRPAVTDLIQELIFLCLFLVHNDMMFHSNILQDTIFGYDIE